MACVFEFKLLLSVDRSYTIKSHIIAKTNNEQTTYTRLNQNRPIMNMSKGITSHFACRYFKNESFFKSKYCQIRTQNSAQCIERKIYTCDNRNSSEGNMSVSYIFN